jgi:GDPmannose 4,6-dehydratase
VTKKIITAAVKILIKKQKQLFLGNLDAIRDWGHAEDYVRGMWLILQHNKPDDFVLATGKSYSIRKFVEIVCNKLGFKIKWKYKKLNEIGYVFKINKDYGYSIKVNQIIIKVSKKYFRPNEVNNLLGNSNLAKKEIGWKPKININALIDEMLKNDLESNI